MIPKPGFFLQPHGLLSRVGIERETSGQGVQETERVSQIETVTQGQDRGARGVSPSLLGRRQDDISGFMQQNLGTKNGTPNPAPGTGIGWAD